MKTVATNAETVETIQTTQDLGDTTTHKETVVATKQVDSKELTIIKFTQVVWLFVHIVGVVISLRFLFLLFGANLNGFASFIFNLSVPFVKPFQGIFSTPRSGSSYFDSASLLALAIWYILGYLVTYIIEMFSNKTTE